MSLQSPRRNVSDAERKLLLLCCVDVLRGATEAQLWTFVAEQSLMDYLSMQLCLHELLVSGQLENGAGALQNGIFLSDAGRQALSLFADRIPCTDRERIVREAPAFRERILQHNQVRAVYEIAQKGDYRARLTLLEDDLPTLSIRVCTSNRAMASKALRSFRNSAARVLTYLYTLSAEPTADDSGIVRHSTHEFTASVVLTAAKVTFEVALLFPSNESARAFLAAFSTPAQKAAAAERLALLLCGVKPTDA